MPAVDDLDQWMTAARERGDQASFARVVEQCHHLIRAVALKELADSDLADEIAQEVLVRAWAKRSQYRPGTSPRAWMLAITRSQVMEHYRRQDRDRRHLRDLERQELLRHRKDEDDALHQERLAALQACLADVGDQHRELLDLIHAQGLSTEDAAELMGIKAPACRQRLSRIQRSLRSCAEERMKGPA
jgi:RNA polymerase sigma factor (sigma-70 family)